MVRFLPLKQQQFIIAAAMLTALLTGCGKTLTRTGTEQLLTSNAVDRVVSQINFSPLAGQKVYFDHQYIKTIKGVGFVNGDYIVSSLRQQLIAANCLLQDKREEADYILEARVGALGSDRHEISYGIPANNLLNTASSLVPSAPPVPAIPEISIAKKNHQVGAAKIGVFAYHRETKEPVWQAGMQSEHSRSKEAWFLGIGPFQSGTIYDGPMFAGTRIRTPLRSLLSHDKQTPEMKPPEVKYISPHLFPLAQKLQEERKLHGAENIQPETQLANQKENKTGSSKVVPASAEEPASRKK